VPFGVFSFFPDCEFIDDTTRHNNEMMQTDLIVGA